jgi:MoaA/NifB/PqqE/SkfB family radical SAM enzyme
MSAAATKLTLLKDRLKLLRDLRINNGTISARYQTVTIETTSTCNLDCPICPARKSDNIVERSSRQIEVDDVRLIVALTKSMTESFCLNIWGEPLLHKKFGEILEVVSSAGLPIWFSTNLNYSDRLAQMLAANPLLHIICSLDGWDATSYAEYRWGGRFDVVKRNLKILGAGACKIYPQYLIGREHTDAEKRKSEFIDFVRTEAGPSANIFFKQKVEEYKNNGSQILPGRCSSMYGGLYFNSDGILIPCCANVRKDVHLRHVSAYTTEDLFNGAEIRTMRKKILDDKNQFSSCRNCKGMDYENEIVTKIYHGLRALFFRKKSLFHSNSARN